MSVVLLLVVFAAPIAVGCVMGAWGWWRPRVHLAQAFARGKAESRPARRVAIPAAVAVPVPALEVAA